MHSANLGNSLLPLHNSFSQNPDPTYHNNFHLSTQLTIKLPSMATGPGIRRSSRRRTGSESAGPSGSEYHESEKSMEIHVPEDDEDPENIAPVLYSTRSGRRILKKTYLESDPEEVPDHPEAAALFNEDVKIESEHSDESSRRSQRLTRLRLRKQTNPNETHLADFVVPDDDEKESGNRRYLTRNRSKKPTSKGEPQRNGTAHGSPSKSQRTRRLTRRTAARASQEEDVYIDQTSSGASADADGSFDDAPQTSSDLDMEPEPEPEPEPEDEGDGKHYTLRQRQPINYAIPPPLEDLPKPPPKTSGGRANGKSGHHGKGGKGRGLGWSASGAELGRWMGMGGDDSDSDYPTRTPRKPFGGMATFGTGAVAGSAGAGGLLPGDLAAAGTPSNLGKIGDAALADADPLGVNVNVTFDEVGGLDDHVHSLKEMTLLPLLYPEVFQKFNITPPRGVLFHGPPGTGKTLLARALAASCRSNGKQISFFMRKGADCLSKWVGEAERQLRLLFEEARTCQPSIIFFDEIDGLAPVRSSKQDQIHASIVSTLLALMDGMDGRGQVVVIGATNRPDAIDPALRRPGRFDREFYFGLPGLEAREKILGIMTRGWEGWGESQGEAGRERLRGLAKLTKGYGGADLRALCTEATLNAIQRRYPQIYKSNDRLLLKPETIGVGLRDFMISIKKLVPSSARSSSSAAAPLPPQFVSLLSDALEKVKSVIERVMPMDKKLSALEEAEFEDEGGEEGALEREMIMQSIQTLRVYRPRIVLHGPVGMGQTYVAEAVLHHLEGYHIQSLELGTLMGDSTRTVEAAIVQLFIEAKRHQPSVIYIPSLFGWCAAVSETSRSTVRAMLDTLAPTDPILLLAIVDGHFSGLPHDVKEWFGHTKVNRVELSYPNAEKREAFFEGLLKDVLRPPNQFADGIKRRKRILEELPIAPPPEPRQPTAAELALQEEADQRVITLLKYRLGPILTELKRKFKRFTKRASEEYNYNFDEIPPPLIEVNGIMENGQNGHTESVEIIEVVQTNIPIQEPQVNGLVNGIVDQQQGLGQPHIPQQQHQQQLQFSQGPPLFNMDLERMHTELYKGRYLTPQDFLDDVGKMVHNANVRSHEDLDRLYKAQAMFTATQVSIQEFDPQLKLECERMAARERQRRREHKKNKEKEKAVENAENNAAALGARRSARNNGQQPELAITDPVKLERRLKRQRGEDSGDSHASEEENGASVRDMKRSRLVAMDGEDEHEKDPLDFLGSRSPLPGKVHTVRFAPEEVEPMQSLVAASNPTERQDPALSDMVVDESPRRSAGFDPFLLNPMTPPGNSFAPSFVQQQGQPEFMLPTPYQPTDASDPFVLPPRPSHPIEQQQNVPRTPTPPSLTTNEDTLRVPEVEKDASPIPMVVERTPTPPLPEFRIDEKLVSDLQRLLRDSTASLTVEQLEQLRATCLGNVWRHRSDWERDQLVKELMDVVREFVQEIADAFSESGSP